MNTYKVKVNNISCSNCAKTITNAILKQDQDANVKVNINNSMVYVQGTLSESELGKSLKECGYPIASENDNAELKAKIDLVISIALSIPLLLGMMNHFAITEPYIPDFLGNAYVQLALATPVQFYIGRRYYKGAYHGLKNHVLGMDFLVVFSTTITYVYSLYLIIVYNGTRPQYFEISALIITIVLIGKVIEEHAKSKTTSLLDGLAKLTNPNVTLEDGTVVDCDFAEVGMRYVILANEKISLDGKIVEGSTYVDESTFSGESKPLLKNVGDEVVGGSLNLNSRVVVEVTTDPSDNMLSQIINSVEEASLIDTKYQRLADRISGYFVPAVISIALITYIVTSIVTGDGITAFENAIAVIVISCPCSLGLATPTSIMVGNSISAEQGVLYKGSKFFEIADKIKVLCFDKTGTITTGKPEVVHFDVEEMYKPMVYAIQSTSNHPISVAVCDYTGKLDTNYNFEVEHVSGIGLVATNDQMKVSIGNKKLIEKTNPSYQQVLDLEARAMAVNVIVVDDQLVGMYGVRDNTKPGIEKVIAKLKKRGIEPVMITGDNEMVAKAISKEVGIEKYYANTMPQDKSTIVESYKENGDLVGFVGDGVNDSIALSMADIAISVKNGNDLAIEASDVTLMDEDLDLIITGLDISKLTRRNIKRNFIWAFSYNVVAIPLAAFGLLNMLLAAIAMGFSSIVVVLNALHLRAEYNKYVKEKR